MSKQRYVLLSFDVEEFDMPLEYQQHISRQQQLTLGKQGLDALHPILSDPSIRTTLFTTANFADHYPDAIRVLSEQHEIASHTYYHSSFEYAHLASSRLRLEAITGKPVTGLRMPRMRPIEMEAVKTAGYGYDASINPTWIPGRYQNLHLPRSQYTEQGMIRIPASVSAWIRFPLFWLSFKNIPYGCFLHMAKQALKKDGYLSLYFHPWEFTDVTKFGLPAYTTRLAGNPLLQRVQQLITDLKKEGTFIGMQEWLELPDGGRRMDVPMQ